MGRFGFDDVVMVYERVDGALMLVTRDDSYPAKRGVTLADVMPSAERLGIPVIAHKLAGPDDVVQTRLA